METVKIKDKKTGAIKTVKKSLASDYVGTGKFDLYKEKEEKKSPRFSIKSEEEK